MKYLQADNFNKVNVGLKSAPNLVRQKATFGTELSDQAVDLARLLIGLQDTYDMERFQEMRQAALTALVVSAPETVASYLINIYFTGDISIQQRCILLSALGVGARELAGLEKLVISFQSSLTSGIRTTATTATNVT
jgi:telomere length regulation protein